MRSLFDTCKDDFYNYLDKHINRVYKHNKTYVNLEKDLEKLKDKFPNVRHFLEGKNASNILNENDRKALLKIISLEYDIDFIEKKEMFKAGFKEAIIFFTEMELLNERSGNNGK